jgi:hypothetical protein
MGGASDSPLETAAGRNGFVSGENPWNRNVCWDGADLDFRLRSSRKVQSPPAREREQQYWVRLVQSLRAELQPGLSIAHLGERERVPMK